MLFGNRLPLHLDLTCIRVLVESLDFRNMFPSLHEESESRHHDTGQNDPPDHHACIPAKSGLCIEKDRANSLRPTNSKREYCENCLRRKRWGMGNLQITRKEGVESGVATIEIVGR